jgi:hypothetical protein
MTSLSALIEDLEAAFGGTASPAQENSTEPEADNAAEEAAPSHEAAPASGNGAYQGAPEEDRADETAAFAEPSGGEAEPAPQAAEEFLIVETTQEIDAGQINYDEIEMELTQPLDTDDIERVIAAEVLSMNGDAMAGSLSESAEDAVKNALDELSMDLADSLAAEPAYKR